MTQFKINGSMYDNTMTSQFKSELNSSEDVVIGIYLLIVCISALFLNTLVIYTCLKNWRSLKISDFHILNLACSDTILPLCAFPLPILSSLSHGWIFEEIGCVIYGFLGFFFGIVSITTLTIMGLTRYASICHPHLNMSNKTFLQVSIVFPYVYGLAWSSVPLVGYGSYSLESYGTSCTLQWNENRLFITLMSLFCIITPTGLIFFSYGFIVMRYRKSSRNIRTYSANRKKVSKKESFLVKTTFAMCWGFLFTWMPYAVVSLWTAYDSSSASSIPIRFTAFAVLIAKSAVVVNPIIYVLMSNKLRPLLLRSLRLSNSRVFASSKGNYCKQLKFISNFIPFRNGSGSSRNSDSSVGSLSLQNNCVVVSIHHLRGELYDESIL